MKLIPGKLYKIKYSISIDECDYNDILKNEIVLFVSCRKQRKGNQTKYTFLYKSKITSTVDLPYIIYSSLEELT